MNRIALAKRLESLSEVFASHTQYSRDLRAMSYVLNKMADDKFNGIISSDYSADSEMFPEEACGPMGPGAGPMGPTEDKPKVIVIEKKEDTVPMPGEGVIPMSLEASEKTAGMFWNKDASKAVVDNLLRDVVGMNKSVCCDTNRKLEKDQVPDGTHAGLPEKPSTLKPEQTPDVSESIETGMVAKSKGTVKKEAGDAKGPGVPDKDGKGPGKDSPECPMNKEKKDKEAGSIKGPGKPDGTGPGKDSPECPMNKEKKDKEASLEDIKKKKEEDEKAKTKKDLEALKKAQKAKEKKASEEDAEEKEEKAEEKEEKAKELLEEAEKDEKDATVEPASSVFEGIELSASMDECELDATEAAELSKLFE